MKDEEIIRSMMRLHIEALSQIHALGDIVMALATKEKGMEEIDTKTLMALINQKIAEKKESLFLEIGDTNMDLYRLIEKYHPPTDDQKSE